MAGVSEERGSRFGRETAQKGGGELDVVFVPKEEFVQVADQLQLIPQTDVLPQSLLQAESGSPYFLAMARKARDHHPGDRSVTARRQLIKIAAAPGGSNGVAGRPGVSPGSRAAYLAS